MFSITGMISLLLILFIHVWICLFLLNFPVEIADGKLTHISFSTDLSANQDSYWIRECFNKGNPWVLLVMICTYSVLLGVKPQVIVADLFCKPQLIKSGCYSKKTPNITTCLHQWAADWRCWDLRVHGAQTNLLHHARTCTPIQFTYM